jgi:hypothetical protein
LQLTYSEQRQRQGYVPENEPDMSFLNDTILLKCSFSRLEKQLAAKVIRPEVGAGRRQLAAGKEKIFG